MTQLEKTNIQKVLIDELKLRYNTATLLLVRRVKLYAFHESNKDWMFNCQGWLIVRKDLYEARSQFISVINPTNFETLFQMEHYSNFANYAKQVSAQFFLFFVVPTQTGPIKLGLCFEDADSFGQFKKVIKQIEYKNRSQDPEGQNDADILEKPDIIQILKKMDINKSDLQRDTLFKDNIIMIIKNHRAMKAAKISQQRMKSKFKTLAIGSSFDQILLGTNDTELIKQLQIELNQYNYRKQS